MWPFGCVHLLPTELRSEFFTTQKIKPRYLPVSELSMTPTSHQAVRNALVGLSLSLSTASFASAQRRFSDSHLEDTTTSAVSSADPFSTSEGPQSGTKSPTNYSVVVIPDELQMSPDTLRELGATSFNPQIKKGSFEAGGDRFSHYQLSVNEVDEATDSAARLPILTLSLTTLEADSKRLEASLEASGFSIISRDEDSKKSSQKLLPQEDNDSIRAKNIDAEERRKEATVKLLANWILGGILISGVLAVSYAAWSIMRVVNWLRTSKEGTPISQSRRLAPENAELGDLRNTPLSMSITPGIAPTLSITLKPTDSIVAESGALLFHKAGIKMDIVSGRSQGFSPSPKNFLKKFFIGESFFFQRFTNTSDSCSEVCLSPSQTGTLVHLDLSTFPSGVCADAGAFFACGAGTSLSIVRRVGAKGLFSGLGMFQQKLTGDGEAFLFARGDVREVHLAEGEVMRVDSGALFMWESSATVALKYLGLFAAITSGEGLFVCEVSGPGKVLVSSRGTEDDTSTNRSNGWSRYVQPFVRYFS